MNSAFFPNSFQKMAVLICLFGSALVNAAEEVDFNRDIRPILSEKCFHCHGPDAESRKADLRLDTEAGSREDLDGSIAIVPGKPDESELIYRVFTDDEDDLMPPSDSKRELSDHERKLLRKWVTSGGDYEEHWAFVRPTRPEISDKNAIDTLVSKRLDEAGLAFSKKADRRTLIRRVSLDLTGLPPSPEQASAFAKDPDPAAYEKLVDSLLASKRFGERWARPWLDLARYADSNGFQADQLRDSWAYRDWVIDAFNDGMPFDQFTIEQLAGDLLPNSTHEQKTATGFHRTVTCNVEAGVHPEENRVNQVVDRVNATATTWLGMTVECAQCHDHKYDPITQKEYFQLFAIFNNTPLEVENKSGKGVSFDFWGPKMEISLPANEEAERNTFQSELEKLKTKKITLETNNSRADWEAKVISGLKTPPKWEPMEFTETETTGGETVTILDDQSALFTGSIPGTTTYEITVETMLENITGFRLEALTHADIPGKGPGRGDAVRSNFVLNEFSVEVITPAAKGGGAVTLHSALADFSQSDWPVANCIDGDPKTGWAIAPEFGKSHWAQFLTEAPIGSKDGVTLKFTLDQNFGRGRTLGRVRISAVTGDVTALDVPKEVATALMKPTKKRNKKEKAAIDAFYGKSNPGILDLNLQILKIEKKLRDFKPPTTLVMVEMEEPRETHLMQRGNYLSPGEKVEAGTPAALHPFDPELPGNRLGLAKWIVSPENPVTPRVAVNRWWAELFGHGIVATLEDFGAQATPPTHPELLDWLAVEFIESDWSMKHMLKLMVMSQTYRQDSNVTPALWKKDPENKLYARGPRFRMSAEMIRDNALTASGLLSTKMQGPPIMPYQPPGLWKQTGRNEPKWIDAKDEDRYRRGIYVVWRRAAPYPSFVNFDGPDRTSCAVNRPRTNTPLQALTLLNDPAYVEMALALANRILTDRPKGDAKEKLSYAFEAVLSRAPVAFETDRLLKLYDERLKHLQANPEEAKAITKSHGFPLSIADQQPLEELAAWFFIANVLLNLDETITKG